MRTWPGHGYSHVIVAGFRFATGESVLEGFGHEFVSRTEMARSLSPFCPTPDIMVAVQSIVSTR